MQHREDRKSRIRTDYWQGFPNQKDFSQIDESKVKMRQNHPIERVFYDFYRLTESDLIDCPDQIKNGNEDKIKVEKRKVEFFKERHQIDDQEVVIHRRKREKQYEFYEKVNSEGKTEIEK